VSLVGAFSHPQGIRPGICAEAHLVAAPSTSCEAAENPIFTPSFRAGSRASQDPRSAPLRRGTRPLGACGRRGHRRLVLRRWAPAESTHGCVAGAGFGV